jgi:hypothetical protein
MALAVRRPRRHLLSLGCQSGMLGVILGKGAATFDLAWDGVKALDTAIERLEARTLVEAARQNGVVSAMPPN